eukprot:TRINITY_DN1702_c0_g1_i15.p1 TRINITY_DN1702_c0_g1~~TRINITY_DN1702_c0_g1_i15.p1  ORF type:complete len:324 (-),score=34.59 TRINITY_DN1702_c0_g1_i15:342-1313(-)
MSSPPLPTASSAGAASTAAVSPATTPRMAVLKTEEPAAPTSMVLDPFPPQPLSSLTAGDVGSSATSGISVSPPPPPPPPPPTAACTPVLPTVPTVGSGPAWEAAHDAVERMDVAAPPRPRVAVRSLLPPAAAAAALAAASAASRPAPAAPIGHPPSRRRPPVSLSAARVSTVRDAALALSLSQLSAAASEALDGGGRAAVRDALLALARKAEGHGPRCPSMALGVAERVLPRRAWAVGVVHRRRPHPVAARGRRKISSRSRRRRSSCYGCYSSNPHWPFQRWGLASVGEGRCRIRGRRRRRHPATRGGSVPGESGKPPTSAPT